MSFLDALRSRGVTVKPHPGWETRSAPIPSYLPDGFNPIGSLAHWDAIKTWPGPALYANNPRFGQPTYHTAIEKDGTVHLISQGYVYGAGGGDKDVYQAMRYDISPVPPARAEKSWNGNPHFYADVVNCWPDGKALPQAQYEALVAVEATRCVINGWNPHTRINDHQGWSTRKADLSGRGWPAPKGWSIDNFRNDIKFRMEDDMPEGFLPLSVGDGQGDRAHKRSDVAAIQAMLNRLGAGLTSDGIYGPTTAAAIAKYLPDRNDPTGRHMFGNRWDDLQWLVAVKAASSVGSGGGLTVPQGDKRYVRKGNHTISL